MKTGYDQFFKKAQKIATSQNVARTPLKNQPANKLNSRMTVKELEQVLKNKHQAKKIKQKNKFPLKMVITSFLGVAVCAYGFVHIDEIEKYAQKIEISIFGSAFAEEKLATESKNIEPEIKDAKKSEAVKNDVSLVKSDGFEHLTNLNERKKQLDDRESELNRVEQELAQQKESLEKRIYELEQMRKQISEKLEDRVRIDNEKVDKLVEFYSNMKPPQAAKVFETMDEDLVVQIISKMKKKNAADILNLLKPEKAQTFSEKFAGYKTK